MYRFGQQINTPNTASAFKYDFSCVDNVQQVIIFFFCHFVPFRWFFPAFELLHGQELGKRLPLVLTLMRLFRFYRSCSLYFSLGPDYGNSA